MSNFLGDLWDTVTNPGKLLDAGIGFLSGEQQNKNSAKASADDRAFQERLSSTAHQREVKDLRAAGLNPILSAGGKGASTPGGSTAKTVGQLNSAFARVNQVAALKQINAQTGLTKASERKTNADAAIAEANLPRQDTYSKIWSKFDWLLTELGKTTSAKERAKNRADLKALKMKYKSEWKEYWNSLDTKSKTDDPLKIEIDNSPRTWERNKDDPMRDSWLNK
nr:MAG: DNA pilot protein [Microvirus sp.]